MKELAFDAKNQAFLRLDAPAPKPTDRAAM